MISKKGTRKVCAKGHVFYKSSDCPVCPTCEKAKEPLDGFPKLSAPARRVLENAKIKNVATLSQWTEKELLKLHGMGPSSLPPLRKALKEKGLYFK